MTELVADQAQREQALDTTGSYIVQAPAGSGKTELLTQRYLALLGRVEHPEEIVAITFTRKAAAEMRNRILGALQLAALDCPAESHRRRTWELARSALARDADRDWQLTRNPSRLRIQTFDSLSHALARQMPLLSELGAAPATTERAEPLYRAAARATLRQLDDTTHGPAIALLLTHLDNRRGQLEDLLTGLLARRDQWLPYALAAPDAGRLEQALESAVVDQLEALRAACANDWLHRLCVVASQAAAQLCNEAGYRGPLRAWHQRDTLPATEWADLAAWRALSDLLLTQKDQPRVKWDKRDGFPAAKEKGLAADIRAARQAAKDEIEALCQRLSEQPEFTTLWAALRLLPQVGLNADQHGVLAALFEVLLLAAAELKLVFADRAEVDFGEMQMRAQQALGDPTEPTDLALALDYRLSHLLVDEFQDTSSSQYRLLETLIAGWQPDDGRTLFAVGDPMQSIYRFREAEVSLYLAAREQGIGSVRLTPLTLQVNFRSSGGIVDWINRGFPLIFPTRTDVTRGAVPYSRSVAFHPTDLATAVEVHPFAGAEEQAEAALVAALAGKALSETSDGQVAVLARTRRQLHTIAAALKSACIAYQAVEVDLLADRPLVRDLFHLTRALLHPADRLSWLVVLRAPWLGLSIDDLLTIAEGSNACVVDRLRDAQLQARLSDDGRRRVQRLLAIIERQLPARGRLPLRQWVESIWLQLGGLAIASIDDPANAANDAQAYLRLLDQLQSANGLLDFAQLEQTLSELYASPDARSDGRVQLMTMHKSKGLEFDTVILPGLGRRPRGAASELLYWLERPTRRGNELLMAPIRAADQHDEAISNYLRALHKDREQLEVARLLYVAATRAKRRLHLLGHINFNATGQPGKPQANSLLERLWPVIGDRFAALQPPTASVDEAALAAPFRPIARLHAEWQPAMPETLVEALPDSEAEAESNRIEFEWAGDTARCVGTLVHRYLERIANDGVTNWQSERVGGLLDSVRIALRNLGVDEDELEPATDKTLRALRNTLSDDTGRWILGQHDEARCEWALTLLQEQPRHFVIDRSFVDPQGVRWIIDYKTGDHLEEDRTRFLDQEQARYHEQLETYGRILYLMRPGPIKLALYFPLFADWRVWDFAP